MTLSKEQWLGILRHVVGGIGPLLVLKGVVDEQTVSLAGGMILSIGAIVASVKAPEKPKGTDGGFAQLTWLSNYGRFSALLGIDLVNNPDLAAEPKTAARIIVEGMFRGLYTGKALTDYITPALVEYRNARRIVNGTDRADMIADYALQFEQALRKAAETANV